MKENELTLERREFVVKLTHEFLVKHSPAICLGCEFCGPDSHCCCCFDHLEWCWVVMVWSACWTSILPRAAIAIAFPNSDKLSVGVRSLPFKYQC